MKNYTRWLGIIVLVAVIGLFAACGGEDQNSEKTIIVTGIPTEYLKADFTINVVPVGSGDPVAVGGIWQLSDSTATFYLYSAGDSIRWTGKGTWNLWLFIIDREFFHANAISITNAVTTIPFSKFTTSWD